MFPTYKYEGLINPIIDMICPPSTPPKEVCDFIDFKWLYELQQPFFT